MAAQADVRYHCLSQYDTVGTEPPDQIGNLEGPRRSIRKNMQRSSFSSAGSSGGERQVNGQFRRCSSLSVSAGLKNIGTSAASQAAMEECLEQVNNSVLLKSSQGSSTSHKAPTLSEDKEKSVSSFKSRNMGFLVPWRWSRMHKGRKKRKVIYLMNRRFDNRSEQKTVTKADCPQGQFFSSVETSTDEIDHVCHFGSSYAYQSKDETPSNTSFSNKYQPKLFQDIVGHEITVKAISNAVEKKKITPLYLFHGPSGTGKTSTARIFAMALNCESTAYSNPCWSCRGCSKSLYIMELCSGSRTAGFEQIKTLIQNTSFTQAIPGFKVLIIEECHSFTAKAWDDLLGILEGGYGSTVVFVLITVDASMVPRNISSRCQKFCFPKLKDENITIKLAKIIAHEDLRIEREAMKLIIAKADGSLREAENILDQLALLGTTITSSMVQQIVGLVPYNKLTDLLATAISGDTINTIRFTKELIATGIESQVLVSQLQYLITDILSGAAVADSSSSAGSSVDYRLLRSRSHLTHNESEKLCYALKILVETENQLRSSTDQTFGIFEALLQISANDFYNSLPTGIAFPSKMALASGDEPSVISEDIEVQRLSGSKYHESINETSEQLDKDRIVLLTTTENIDTAQRCMGKEAEKEHNKPYRTNIEEIWQNMLERIQSQPVKEFLCHQVKLASLTISSANAIVHLMFKRPEDKMAAQMSEESISKALEKAIGCPVTVNMSLEPEGLGIIKENTVSTSHPLQQQKTPFLSEFVQGKNYLAATNCSTAQDNMMPAMLKNCMPYQEHDGLPSEEKDVNSSVSQLIVPFHGLLAQKNQFDKPADSERERASIGTSQTMTANKPKHRWLSSSSIPQSDANVEPYSRDISFENKNKERECRTRKNLKIDKGLLKASEDHNSQDGARNVRLNHSCNCTDILCPRKMKVIHTA